MYKLTNTESIIRLADNAHIPFDPTNTDGVVWDDLLRLTVVSICTVPAP